MSESIKINALTSSGVAESAHHFRTKDEQSEVLTPPTQSTYDEQPISKNLIETQFGVKLEQFDHNFRKMTPTIPSPTQFYGNNDPKLWLSTIWAQFSPHPCSEHQARLIIIFRSFFIYYTLWDVSSERILRQQ